MSQTEDGKLWHRVTLTNNKKKINLKHKRKFPMNLIDDFLLHWNPFGVQVMALLF